MCLGAIYWARLDRVYFGGTAADAAAAGFDDAFLYQQIAVDSAAAKTSLRSPDAGPGAGLLSRVARSAGSHKLLRMNPSDALEAANQDFARAHPGESGDRQPVHVVYGGAHLFKHDVARRLGQLAMRAVEEYAPDAATLALAVGIPNSLADTVYDRVIEKLRREPVEDFRIDFEDGYGIRPDAEEDTAAIHAAAEVARAMQVSALPPFSASASSRSMKNSKPAPSARCAFFWRLFSIAPADSCPQTS